MHHVKSLWRNAILFQMAKKYINWEFNTGILIKGKPENRAKKKIDSHQSNFFWKLDVHISIHPRAYFYPSKKKGKTECV